MRARNHVGSLARLAAPSLRDRIRSLPSLPAAFVATIGDQGSDHRLADLREAGVPVAVVHSDRDLAIWWPFAKVAARTAGATLVRVEGAGHSWLIEHPDSLPALLRELLDDSFGASLAERARGPVADMWATDALGLVLDQPKSRPYVLEPGHTWRVETTG